MIAERLAGPRNETVLADELLSVLGSLRRQARRVAGRPWPLAEVSGAQTELIRLVRRTPNLAVAEAAAELGLAPNTVSTLVSQLVAHGVLQRTRDSADRRVARLELTTSATRRVGHWRDERSAAVAEALMTLSPADRAVLAEAVPVIARLSAAIADQPSRRPERVDG